MPESVRRAELLAPGHLGELTWQIPVELVDAVLAETGSTQRRLRVLPSRVGVYFVLAMCLFPGLGYRKVWAKLTAALPGRRRSLSDKALRDLRRRLGAAPMRSLFEVLAGPVAAPDTPGVRFGHYRTVAFDGCVSFKVADSDRNRCWLGKLKASLGVTGYPVIRLMSVVETGTRALLGAVFGPPSTGETDYARRLLHLLNAQMLVLCDRGFDGETFLTELAGTGAQFLVRLCATRRLPVLARLDDGSYLSRIGTLPVRIITADITVTCADGTRYTAAYRLATTLCDPRRYPARRFIAVYHQRWEHEIAYLALRHTLAAGRVLRSTDPAGLEQEMWALLTVYQALRRAMVSAVESRPGTDPDRASFTTALETAKDLLVNAANVTNDTDLVGHIGRAVLADLLPPRRPRTSVRKVKSPLSRYNKKDPYRPERSTPITSITAIINDPEPKHATHESKSLTTALGP
ncbi:IS4 family transposase [Mycobacterium sp. SM1]|uniref:IS4 family transposase n=1 Tax=Mycobacterium sp. SM1 TaxID=2816243 RepID=UPI001BCDD43B|nr:IS4 family transposase [Mycobacterium sp. SM1]MBS4728752.1 IS4 family transposase [Mycobacterium sp. SM1]MBS4729077.1 IS4 family transposase [Mycobacterium sp. SM1]MBS4729938.1 IS4 family transposase [Mycobacterium sp. SM1]